MNRIALAVCTIALAACATGPRRQALPEFLNSPEEPRKEAMAPSLEPEAPEPAPASPFSAGLMLGVGVPLDGTQVLPAQLAAGTLRVLDVRGQGLNLLALGGVSQTPVSSARLAWGLGAGYQLTPERLAYEVDVAAGVLWIQEEASPAAVLGFVLTPDM